MLTDARYAVWRAAPSLIGKLPVRHFDGAISSGDSNCREVVYGAAPPLRTRSGAFAGVAGGAGGTRISYEIRLSRQYYHIYYHSIIEMPRVCLPTTIVCNSRPPPT